MLKFTQLFNFGMAGVLIVPAVTQELDSTTSIETSLRHTDAALATLNAIEVDLSTGDYNAVRNIINATEAPFGGARERDALLDRLRNEIGELGSRVERIQGAPALPHLDQDPTERLTAADLANTSSSSATTGLTQEGRNDLGNIWPPVPGVGTSAPVRTDDNRYSFEEDGFTVDAVLQGRAYYRAGRFTEALTLLRTRHGDASADYWTGRCFERLGRTREAMAAYTSVMNNTESTVVQADRAKQDREFLEWLVDFDRKIKDLSTLNQEAK